MAMHLPSPRLLPLTIGAMTALLLVEVGDLSGVAWPQAGRGQSTLMLSAARAETAPPAHEAAPSAASAGPAPVGAASLVPAPPAAPAATEKEMQLLQDLRARRAELDGRAAALDSRQAVLDAAEKRMAARVQELADLQKRLEVLEAARKQQQEANWAGLTKVYEAMKPRDAATIFNDLEMPVLLQMLDRMKEAKAAPVLAAMQPDRAREATTKLAAMRLRGTTLPGAQASAAPPPSPAAPVAAPAASPGVAPGPGRPGG